MKVKTSRVRILKPKNLQSYNKLLTEYRRAGYTVIAGGSLGTMNEAKSLYKKVKGVIVKSPTFSNYYTYIVEEKSFKENGFTWL